jgi:hypothetical protein
MGKKDPLFHSIFLRNDVSELETRLDTLFTDHNPAA